MDIDDTPVLDNHLHLDPVNGRNVAAAEEFASQGGTHLLVLNKPSWHLVEKATDEAIFREVSTDCRGRRHSDRGTGRARRPASASTRH